MRRYSHSFYTYNMFNHTLYILRDDDDDDDDA